MSLEESFFKKYKPNDKKLIKYGFILKNNTYIFEQLFLNDKYKAIITIDNNKVSGEVIDLDLNDEFFQIRVNNVVGEYINTVKSEYLKILEDIKNNCFEESLFIYPQTNRVATLIKNKYNVLPEFLFDDDTTGVFKNNGKWIGIIMNINYNKFNKDIDRDIEVINVKLNNVDKYIDNKTLFPSYHMNKKYWVSIVLDDTCSDDYIMKLINESYLFTCKHLSSSWVLPTNIKMFDVEDYLDNSDVVYWPRKASIAKDSIVYIYMGSPISAIVYKCKVIDIDNDNMRLKRIKKYSKDKYNLTFLKEHNLTSIRGARTIPKELEDILIND